MKMAWPTPTHKALGSPEGSALITYFLPLSLRSLLTPSSPASSSCSLLSVSHVGYSPGYKAMQILVVVHLQGTHSCW